MSPVARAKLDLIFSMAAFGTIGIFVRSIPLPSSVIALVRGANRPCGDQRRNIVSCTAKKSPARIIYRTHPITNDNGRATSTVTCWTTCCMTFL